MLAQAHQIILTDINFGFNNILVNVKINKLRFKNALEVFFVSSCEA